MNQRNYLKLVWILAFLIFGGISCWATAESLNLLLPTWPVFACWAVTIVFFIVASIGTKMIVDSLNQDIYLDHRTAHLFVGISLVVVFWLLCSMPTNTHTFFYRTSINNLVTNDIVTTQSYLNKITDNTKNKELASRKVEELHSNITNLLGDLAAEIRNEANPGNGPEAKKIRRKLAEVLGRATSDLDGEGISALSYKGTSKQDREKLIDGYEKKIRSLEEFKAKDIANNIMSPSKNMIKKVNAANQNLSLLKKYIEDGTIDLNNPEDISGTNGVCAKLNEAYSLISENRDFVTFKNDEDKQLYTANKPETKINRLISVIDVWIDFINGKFTGTRIIFWVIISILIDIAAFIFFDLAFKKGID